MDRIPLIVTYNRNLPDLKSILEETWGHLQINPTVKAKFVNKPIVCYKRNRNLRDILGQTKISKNRVVRKKATMRGRCAPCLGRSDAMCCNHVISTSFFTNNTGEARYEIRHRTNCRTKNAIYLGFCIKCNKRQYVGKVKSQGANKRINRDRNDVSRPDAISIDKHFNQPGQDFNRDFQMIIIEEKRKRT